MASKIAELVTAIITSLIDEKYPKTFSCMWPIILVNVPCFELNCCRIINNNGLIINPSITLSDSDSG